MHPPGGEERPARRRLTADEAYRTAWLRRRYIDDQASVVDLAVEAGVHAMTVYRWLARAGIGLRRGPVAILSRDWLAGQLDDGATVSVIARRAGVVPSTVLDQLSAHGLFTDGGGES